MTIHISQDALSATMAHFLTRLHGSRFMFSRDMLVGQMLNKLEEKNLVTSFLEEDIDVKMER